MKASHKKSTHPLASPQAILAWLLVLMVAKLVLLPTPDTHADVSRRERIQMPSSAEGSGVGNGGSEEVDTLAQQFLIRMNNGVAILPRDLAEATGWCSRAGSVLNEALAYADRFEREARLGDAEAVLRRTLEVARNSLAVNASSGPITHRLVQRGMNTLISLDRADPEIPLISKLNFLKNYVAFIVRVASDLDQNWYLPNRYASGTNETTRAEDFRRSQAQRQTEFNQREAALRQESTQALQAARQNFPQEQRERQDIHEQERRRRVQQFEAHEMELRHAHERAISGIGDSTLRARMGEDFTRETARRRQDHTRTERDTAEDFQRSQSDAERQFTAAQANGTRDFASANQNREAEFTRSQAARETGYQNEVAARSVQSQAQFEQKFVQFVSEQIQLVLSAGFTETTAHFGDVIIVPVGSDRAVLTLAEWMTIGAADDLAQTLSSYHLADPSQSISAGRCAHLVEEMRSFHQMLSSFNAGVISPFRSRRQAMQNVRANFTQWISNLNACN